MKQTRIQKKLKYNLNLNLIKFEDVGKYSSDCYKIKYLKVIGWID